MPRGVREDSPPFARLLIGLACSRAEQSSLGKVQVIHLKVEVRLLRLLLSRPPGRSMALDTLEAEEEAVGAAQTREVVPRAVRGG